MEAAVYDEFVNHDELFPDPQTKLSFVLYRLDDREQPEARGQKAEDASVTTASIYKENYIVIYIINNHEGEFLPVFIQGLLHSQRIVQRGVAWIFEARFLTATRLASALCQGLFPVIHQSNRR